MISSSDLRSPLGITVGDFAGVGPELALRAWEEVRRIRPSALYGDVRWLRAAAQDLSARNLLDPSMVTRLWAVDVEDVTAALNEGAVPVINVEGREAPSYDSYPWARAVPDFGLIQYRSLIRAVRDAREGALAGVVTLPWHKARLLSAGLPATGHTEVLAKECGVENTLMLLAGETLRVALVTTHVPLYRVPELVTADRIVETAVLLNEGLKRDYDIQQPQIAVCGLNPHAGESGTMGDEEQDIIRPAIARLNDKGVLASGPYPADTLFPMVLRGQIKADGVLAMYHDQGLAPLKTHHLGAAANITMGLPIVRTSVDHGTAYDIAGSGVVDDGSFVYACRLASRFALRRNVERMDASTNEFETL